MGLFRKYIHGMQSFKGGLSLPSSIKNARSARKHYRGMIKARGIVRAQVKNSMGIAGKKNIGFGLMTNFPR